MKSKKKITKKQVKKSQSNEREFVTFRDLINYSIVGFSFFLFGMIIYLQLRLLSLSL